MTSSGSFVPRPAKTQVKIKFGDTDHTQMVVPLVPLPFIASKVLVSIMEELQGPHIISKRLFKIMFPRQWAVKNAKGMSLELYEASLPIVGPKPDEQGTSNIFGRLGDITKSPQSHLP